MTSRRIVVVGKDDVVLRVEKNTILPIGSERQVYYFMISSNVIDLTSNSKHHDLSCYSTRHSISPKYRNLPVQRKQQKRPRLDYDFRGDSPTSFSRRDEPTPSLSHSEHQYYSNRNLSARDYYMDRAPCSVYRNQDYSQPKCIIRPHDRSHRSASRYSSSPEPERGRSRRRNLPTSCPDLHSKRISRAAASENEEEPERGRTLRRIPLHSQHRSVSPLVDRVVEPARVRSKTRVQVFKRPIAVSPLQPTLKLPVSSPAILPRSKRSIGDFLVNKAMRAQNKKSQSGPEEKVGLAHRKPQSSSSEESDILDLHSQTSPERDIFDLPQKFDHASSVLIQVIKAAYKAVVGSFRNSSLASLRARALKMYKPTPKPTEFESLEILSLKCAFSQTRIIHPIKGPKCKHAQCFCLASILPTLKHNQKYINCPICCGKFDVFSVGIDVPFLYFLKKYQAHDKFQLDYLGVDSAVEGDKKQSIVVEID